VIAGDDDYVTLVGGRMAEVWNLHSMDAYWA
jgi:hypothetical protein